MRGTCTDSPGGVPPPRPGWGIGRLLRAPPPRPRHPPAHSGALGSFTRRTEFPPALGSGAGRGGVRSDPKAVCPGGAPARVGVQPCGRCRPPPAHPPGGPRHTPATNAPGRSSASPRSFLAETRLAGSSSVGRRDPHMHRHDAAPLCLHPGITASRRGARPEPEAPLVCGTCHTAGRDFQTLEKEISHWARRPILGPKLDLAGWGSLSPLLCVFAKPRRSPNHMACSCPH